MRWFKMYSELLNDRKVQTLPPELLRAWLNLLCIANDHTRRGYLPDLEDVAFLLRIPPYEADGMLAALIGRGLLDRTTDGSIAPHNWDERQANEEKSTERVRRHRKKVRSAKAQTMPDPTPPERGETGVEHVPYRSTETVERKRNGDGTALEEIRGEEKRVRKESPSNDVDSSRVAVVDVADPRVISPEHREAVEHARAAYGDTFADVVVDRGLDIARSTGGRWDCFRAAIDSAKRSKRRLDDLYVWCLKTAQQFAATGIPPAPIAVEPSAPKVDRNGRPILGPEEKAAKDARLKAQLMGDIHGR